MKRKLLWLAAACSMFACRPHMQERSDFAKHFTEASVEGAFVLYDLQRDKYFVHDLARSNRGFVPASTFKIFNALVALETGVLRDENETLQWDGVTREVAAWNQDHSLRSGFKVSAVWFYQEMARRIGPERMQHYVNLAGYGNRDIRGGIDLFWLTGELRITPREQIDFLVRLYQNRLPFAQSTLTMVKDIFIFEQNENYVLRGKTGWAGKTGWFVGYVERKEAVYFFATNIDIAKDEDVKARIAVTKNILRDLRLIEP
ncbi:MAG: class D beta-lactamase [candidate division KSB1 bacterium]